VPTALQASCSLPTRRGDLVMHVFGDGDLGPEEVVAVVYRPDVETGQPPLVRLHSACFTGDVLGSLRCDCGSQLAAGLDLIQREGHGILLYLLRHEGRGIGMANKVRAYALQERGFDTVEANLQLGLPVDARDYGAAVAALRQLGVGRVRLATNNPAKVQALVDAGIEVERVPLRGSVTPHNAEYLRVKSTMLGHLDSADQPLAGAEGSRWTSAEDYEELARGIQLRNATLVARLHPEPGDVATAYEIGCGTGLLTETLVRTLPTASIDAVDTSADMLATARAKPWPDRVRFLHGTFPDVEVGGRYDAVFSNAALHWMHPRYAEVFAAIQGMLAPRGLLCAATAGRTPATVEFGQRVRRALSRVVPDGPGDSFDRRRLTVDEVVVLAGDAGLEVDDAFVVERSLDTTAAAYARWWVASGGPWRGDEVRAADAVRLVVEGLGGPDEPLRMVHASVLMVLRKRAR
jgi:GTP cyclohydrolase II